MPALPSVPGVLKCQLNFLVGSDPSALCRFFIHYSGTAPVSTDAAAFATILRTSWASQMSPFMVPPNALTSTFVEDLSSASGAIGTDSTTVVGTDAGSPTPAQSALMIGFQIARRYRGGKPKIFLPIGDSANINTNGTWKAALLALVTPAWAQFMTDVKAGGWTGAGTLTHVNVSYYQGFTVVTNPVTHRARNVPTLRGAPVVDTVTGYATEATIANQRRRNEV